MPQMVLLFVVYFAFTGRDGSFTLRNFEKFFQPMYLSALVLSLKLAFFCTLICLLVGYPAAKFLASRDFSAAAIVRGAVFNLRARHVEVTAAAEFLQQNLHIHVAEASCRMAISLPRGNDERRAHA